PARHQAARVAIVAWRSSTPHEPIATVSPSAFTRSCQPEPSAGCGTRSASSAVPEMEPPRMLQPVAVSAEPPGVPLVSRQPATPSSTRSTVDPVRSSLNASAVVPSRATPASEGPTGTGTFPSGATVANSAVETQGAGPVSACAAPAETAAHAAMQAASRKGTDPG